MSQENEKYILRGPLPHKATPEESLGIQIYNSLRSKDASKDIIIDAFTGRVVRIEEFLEKSCRLARSLSNCGYNINDLIGICSENNASYFIPVVAALYQGICLAPINHQYTKGELHHTLSITKPTLIFCSNKTMSKFVSLKETEACIKRIVVFDLKEKANGVEDFEEFLARNCNAPFDVDHFRPIDVNTREHLATIMCSSGTTGLPKGVILTHRNLTHRMVQTNDDRYYLNFPNATFMGVLPFFHTYGFMSGLGHILEGQRVVVLERFQEEVFLESIQNYKISNLWIVPPIVVFLTKSPLVQRYDLSSVKEVASGSAPLGKEAHDKMKEIFSLERVVQGYGLTETTMAVIVGPVGYEKSGSCGKVVPAMSVKIRDTETGESLPAGKVGELCVKGDMVMKGYLGNEEATNGTFHNGWLLTGDLGYYDEEGFFYIVDRLKELIKYKGYQVAPAELEAVLLSNPKIKDAAVIGLPKEDVGEVPCAYVVKQSGVDLSEDEVKGIIADQLSPQKHLRGGVRFVQEIPKNPSGKILRRELRKEAYGSKS